MRSLLTTVILAAASASLLAQSAPVKMGLWEKTIVTDIGDGTPRTMKDQSCITPQAWQKMTAEIGKPHEGCKMNNVRTGNGYTFSGTCGAQGSSIVINGSETIKDSEHIVAESHSTAVMNGKTRQISIHSTSQFLGSSCGSVKPEDASTGDR